MWDDGAKFIWYDQIDKILSHTTKANGVPGAMDQGVPVFGTGTSTAPMEGCEDPDGDGEPSCGALITVPQSGYTQWS